MTDELAYYYLIRYGDYTLDVVPLSPMDIPMIREHEGVFDVTFVGSYTQMQLSRDALYLLLGR